MPLIYDQALYQLVIERLRQDKRTAGLTLDITCADGCISLTGLVDTEDQKEAVLWLVEGMTGVRTVMDNILIRRVGPSNSP